VLPFDRRIRENRADPADCRLKGIDLANGPINLWNLAHGAQQLRLSAVVPNEAQLRGVDVLTKGLSVHHLSITSVASFNDDVDGYINKARVPDQPNDKRFAAHVAVALPGAQPKDVMGTQCVDTRGHRIAWNQFYRTITTALSGDDT
jgi:hypothetical protein